MEINELKINAEDFFRKHRRVTVFLSTIGFLLSAYFTYLSYLTKSDLSIIHIGTISLSIVALCSTLLVDGAKTVFFVTFQITKKREFFVMWIIAMVFSIIFSISFFTLQEAKEENNTNNSTLLFNEKKAEKDRIDAQINDKRKSLDQAIKDKDKMTSSLSQQQKDNQARFEALDKAIKDNKKNLTIAEDQLKYDIGKGFYGQQDADNAEIKRLNDQINKDIKSRDSLSITGDTTKIDADIKFYNDEINRLTEDSKKVNYDVTPNAKMESTVIPLLTKISFISIGKSSFIFDLLRSIAMELFSCYLYSISQMGNTNKNYSPTSPNGKGRKKKDEESEDQDTEENSTGIFDSIKNLFKDKKENITTAKNDDSPTPSENEDENLNDVKKSRSNSKQTHLGSVIDFSERQKNTKPKKEKSTKVTENDKSNYMNYGLTHLEDGYLPPRSVMAKGLGISEDKCKVIHKELKNSGLLITGRKKGIPRTWFASQVLKNKKA